MNLIYLAIIVIFAVVATVFCFLWRVAHDAAKTFAETAVDMADDKVKVTGERDWYQEEYLRLQGAVQRLSEMVFAKKQFIKILDAAINSTCAMCDKDKTVDEIIGIPEACRTCVIEEHKRTLNALKGAPADGTK